MASRHNKTDACMSSESVAVHRGPTQVQACAFVIAVSVVIGGGACLLGFENRDRT